jgi:hypothetical protein
MRCVRDMYSYLFDPLLLPPPLSLLIGTVVPAGAFVDETGGYDPFAGMGDGGPAGRAGAKAAKGGKKMSARQQQFNADDDRWIETQLVNSVSGYTIYIYLYILIRPEDQDAALDMYFASPSSQSLHISMFFSLYVSMSLCLYVAASLRLHTSMSLVSTSPAIYIIRIPGSYRDVCSFVVFQCLQSVCLYVSMSLHTSMSLVPASLRLCASASTCTRLHVGAKAR